MQTIAIIVELGVLFFLLCVVIAILWTGIYHLVVLKVPFVPTPRRVAREMVALAELKGSEYVLDLGAGTGTILAQAKKLHPGITAVGYEIVPTVWLAGRVMLWLTRSGVELRRADAMTADVHRADVIFLYLTGEMLGKLQAKFDRELRPGTLVLSHAFRFPGREPVREVQLPWGHSTTRVLVYRW